VASSAAVAAPAVPVTAAAAAASGGVVVLSRRSSRAASPLSLIPSPSAAAAADAGASSSAAAAAAAPPPARSLRSSLFKGVLFLLTGTRGEQTDQLSKLITHAGGRCIESLSELPAPSAAASSAESRARILVLASAPKRTMKFMFSLARGLPPLQPAWLEACIAAGQVLAPSDTQLVPLKEEGGEIARYPSAWLRSLRDRGGTHPLPLSKCILFGMRIAVVGSSNSGSFVPDVSVVCREAGALVWSAEAEAKPGWHRWHEEEGADDSASAVTSSPAAAGSRGSSRRPSAAAAAGASSNVSSVPRVDLVIADAAHSLNAWIKRALTEAPSAGSRSSKARSSLPPVVGVKFLLQCLMQQKRLPDAEREEYLL